MSWPCPWLLAGPLRGNCGCDIIDGMSDVSIQRDGRTGRFKPGNIGGGRPPGARNKLGEQFLHDLAATWRELGPQALRRCAEEDPSAFLRVVASLMPREVNIDVDI